MCGAPLVVSCFISAVKFRPPSRAREERFRSITALLIYGCVPAAGLAGPAQWLQLAKSRRSLTHSLVLLHHPSLSMVLLISEAKTYFSRFGLHRLQVLKTHLSSETRIVCKFLIVYGFPVNNKCIRETFC